MGALNSTSSMGASRCGSILFLLWTRSFEVALLPADKPLDTPKQIMEEREERAERQEKGKSGKRAVA
jgi:hypothetical protein